MYARLYFRYDNGSFVTNAPSHAQKLARKGMEVILIGGRLKQSTEAVVGEEACRQIEKFNFSLGFLGSNGVSERSGFSTPDQDEAMVKKSNRTHPPVLCSL